MRALLLGLLLLLSQADPSAEALKTIDEDTLKAHESVLASDAMEGRAAGVPGNAKAVEYLVKEAESYGLKPAGADGYLQEFEFETQGEKRKAKNVIGLLEGSDPELKGEYVLIGGHLDHVGRAGQAVSGQKDGGEDGRGLQNRQ